MRPATVAVFPSPIHAKFLVHTQALKPLCRTAFRCRAYHFLPTRLPEDLNLHKTAAWMMVSRAILNLDETITKGACSRLARYDPSSAGLQP
jgi:hypothetical protein